jgi:hypothetical protein
MPRRVPYCRVAWCIAFACLLALALPATAGAALPPGAVWTAKIDGRSVNDTSTSNPIRLTPGEPVEIIVRVENRSPTPVAARYVRLEGGVLGLRFYVFTTTVDLQAQPGGWDERTFTIDLLDLGTQASGLLPSRLVLLDAAGGELDAKPLLVDVRGSVSSVYAGFGLAVGGITVLLIVGALWRLARGRLPRNRWRRGLVLAAPGLGIGFTLTFTLSALRWAAPSGGVWTTFLILGAAAGFVAGYLSPTPAGADEPDDLDHVGPDAPDAPDTGPDGPPGDTADGPDDEAEPAAVGDDTPWWRSR